MKVLLLGANGQLGTDIQRVIESASDSRITCIPFTRKQLDVENVESIHSTLTELDFDVLINCTSYHKTDEVEDNGGKAITVNAHAVEQMADACRQKNSRFVHISTDYVFSGEKNTPYSENDRESPINVYGTSKLLGETLSRMACPSTYILRVASLFGIAGASGKGGNFIETMLRLAKERDEVRVVDDIRMSPTSTHTIANVILEILRKEPDYGIYHVVNAGDATWHEFAEFAIRSCKMNVPVVAISSSEFPTRAKRPSYSVLDNSKISSITDIQIPHWKTAVQKYLKEKNYID